MSEKRQRKNFIQRFLAFGMAMLMTGLVGVNGTADVLAAENDAAAESSAAETGSVTVNFPVADTELAIYKVGMNNQDGSEDTNSSYTLIAPFDQYQADMRDSNAATTLAGYVTSDESVEPLATATTDEDGNAVFTNLSEGVYLIPSVTAVTENGTYISQAILLELPQWVNKELTWTVTVDDKWELIPPEKKKTELTVLKVWKDDDEKTRPESITVVLLQNGETAKDITDADGTSVTEIVLSEANNWSYTWEDLDAECSWTVKEKQVPTGYTVSNEADGTRIVLTNTKENPSTPETPKKLPQTGQLWWPVLALIAGGLFCILLGLLAKRRS